MDILLPGRNSDEEGVEQNTGAENQHSSENSPRSAGNEERHPDPAQFNNERELESPRSVGEDRAPTDGGYGNEEKLNNEDTCSDTDKSSISDGELEDSQQRGGSDSSGLSSSGIVNRELVMSRNKGEKAGHNVGEEGSRDTDPNGFGSRAQAPSYNAAASSSRTHEEFESNETSPESPRIPSPRENKPSSQTKLNDNAVDLREFDDSRSEESRRDEEEFIKKGFTCGADNEEEDEELREHWTRALQTSTSTGEIVEKIVKVLKHKQKTHDLLCPVCGSCVTKRVILRKRKRSSLISVDRWYKQHLDGDEVREADGTLSETLEPEYEEQDTQEIEAFGCLACFSLFYKKGVQLLSQLQEIGPDTVNCLPFFFPPYPWGITQIRERRTGTQAEVLPDEVVEEVASQDAHEQSLTSTEPDFTCGLGSALLPEYPWGTTQFLSKDLKSIPKEAIPTNLESVEPQIPSQPDISEAVPQLDGAERICTCGLLPALLPDYYWGTSARDADKEAESTPEMEDKASSFDLGSAVVPDYPWGVMSESQEPPEDGLLRTNRPSVGSGITFLQNGAIGSALLPSYPWGKCSVHKFLADQPDSLQPRHDDVDGECTCGLGLSMLPKFPWGQTGQTPLTDQNDPKFQTSRVPAVISSEEVKKYVESETTIEAHITTKTDEYTVTTTKMTYPGEVPPQSIKNMTPTETSQTIKHLTVDQKITKTTAIITVEAEGEVLQGKSGLPSTKSTGFAEFENLVQEEEAPMSEIREDSELLKDSSQQKPEQAKLQKRTSVSKMFSFEWLFGKLGTGEVKASLLDASNEPGSETVITFLEPSQVDQSHKYNLTSIFKFRKPSDESGFTTPLLLPTSAHTEETQEIKPVLSPRSEAVPEAVIDVDDHGGTTVEPAVATSPAIAPTEKRPFDDWDILKSIVFGGLDICIASLGVTSSAAGGNAITRTVVYMGVATLLSGLIGFYHNVLNLYHHYRDYYTAVVGLSLMLHGTVAIVSYFVFGLLSSVVYAFSYRKTDDRDDKFILCCGVTIAAVIVLSLCKAKVSNKPYVRTVISYLGGGVLAAIIGYLTGEHVAELLEQWGI